MFDIYWETDATLLLDDLSTPQERVTKSLPLVENTLEWYDHMACAFLLYEDPSEALEKISLLRSNYSDKLEGWRQIVLTPLFQSKNTEESTLNMSEKLAEVLHVLKYHRLLNLLEIAVVAPSTTVFLGYQIGLFMAPFGQLHSIFISYFHLMILFTYHQALTVWPLFSWLFSTWLNLRGNPHCWTGPHG